MWPAKAEKEIDFNGIKISFTWDMTTFRKFEDLRNLPLSALGLELSNPKMGTIVDFFFAGYLRHCEKAKEEVKYGSDFFDEIVFRQGIEKAIKLMNEVFNDPTDNDESKKKKVPEQSQ